MLEIPSTSPQPESYGQYAATKTPDQLAQSITDRQRLINQNLSSTQAESYRHQLEILENRQSQLDRLAKKTSVSDIDASLKWRRDRLETIKNNPQHHHQLQALEVEVLVLKQTRSDLEFTQRIKGKTFTQLERSILDRQLLLDRHSPHHQPQELTHGISLLKAELKNREQAFKNRLTRKTLGDTLQSLTDRQALLQKKDSRHDRRQLEMEITWLQQRLKQKEADYQTSISHKNVKQLDQSILEREILLKSGEPKRPPHELRWEIEQLKLKKSSLAPKEASSETTFKPMPQEAKDQPPPQINFDHYQEFNPHLRPSQRQNKLEELMAQHPELRTPEEKRAWLLSHNRNIALDYFIDSERQWLRQIGLDEWRNAPDWKTKWLSNHDMLRIANDHAIPMIFTLDGSHARVLTRAPQKLPNGSYQLHVYNPFYEDEQIEIVRPDSSKGIGMLQYSNSVPAGIHGYNATYDYDSVIRAATDINYDLTIPTIPGKEWLTRAKRGALQVNEGYNCTLWCVFYAALANSMKPGFNEFKYGGHEKWMEKYGIYLFKYEDIAENDDFRVININAGDPTREESTLPLIQMNQVAFKELPTMKSKSRIDLKKGLSSQFSAKDTEYSDSTTSINNQRFLIEAASTVGDKRTTDEDYCLYDCGSWEGAGKTTNWHIAAILDGAGGMGGGDEASRVGADTIKKTLSQITHRPKGYFIKDNFIGDEISDILDIVNSESANALATLKKELEDQGKHVTPTTTIAGVLIIDDQWLAINAGDSRVYKRDQSGKLTQLTDDHSLVQSLLDKKIITPQQASQYVYRNIISNQLGSDKGIAHRQIILNPGDSIIIACDGLTEAYDEEYIPPKKLNHTLSTILKNSNANSAAQLIDKRPGLAQDNISIIHLRPLSSRFPTNKTN